MDAARQNNASEIPTPLSRRKRRKKSASVSLVTFFSCWLFTSSLKFRNAFDEWVYCVSVVISFGETRDIRLGCWFQLDLGRLVLFLPNQSHENMQFLPVLELAFFRSRVRRSTDKLFQLSRFLTWKPDWNECLLPPTRSKIILDPCASERVRRKEFLGSWESKW